MAILYLSKSLPFIFAPVDAKYNPTLGSMSLRCERKYEDPTSVKNPKAYSGMNHIVFSVAILIGENIEIPHPVPQTNPFHIET